jgi:hypothetical protein
MPIAVSCAALPSPWPSSLRYFDLLVYLMQNRDRVVSKDDLIASVWGGRIVSDSTLTSRFKGRSVDVKQVGRALGVRYVLEGSLRKAGNRIRVTAQLVEAETGKHIWAERYDRDLVDIFAVQDEITEAVTLAVAPAIADAELHRAMRKPPGSLDAWAAYQRGLWHSGKANAEDNALAETFFQQAFSRL